MAFLVLLAALILPPLLTLMLPARLLPLWVLLVFGAPVWAYTQLDGVDGPSGFFGYALLGIFTLLNWPAALVRCIDAVNKAFPVKGGYSD